MSKYIDAGRLKAEIERLYDIARDTSYNGEIEGEMTAYDKILSLITPLQQEQPKFKVGDTIHKIGENTAFPMTIERISDGDYACDGGKCFVSIKFQDDYELVEQEQPETDLKSPFTGGKVAILSRQEEETFRGEKVKILRKYYRCEDTGREFTNDKLDDDMMWAVFRAYCEKKGMTSFTDIMLKQEQPEVDLEKEIAEWQGYEAFPEGTNITPLPKAMNIVEKTAKHFYELGLNARKEE